MCFALNKNIKPGTKVHLITNDSRSFIGTILPDSDSKKVVIKLDSGYNIGLLNSNIKSSKIISKQEIQKKSKDKKILFNKNLPNIAIIHTGGTIASQVDYETGAVNAKFEPDEIIDMFPELKNL